VGHELHVAGGGVSTEGSIFTAGNLTVTGAAGINATGPVHAADFEAHSGKMSLKADSVSSLNGHSVSVKRNVTIATDSWSTAANLTLTAKHSAYVKITLEGTLGTTNVPAVHVAEYLIMHNNGYSPEPNGCTPNSCDTELSRTGLQREMMLLGNYNDDVALQIKVSQSNSGSLSPKSFLVKYKLVGTQAPSSGSMVAIATAEGSFVDFN